MPPTARLAALLASVTVLVMFFAIVYGVPLLRDAGVTHPALLSVASLLASAGVYRLLLLAASFAANRIEWIRSLILGPYYMHGTWVGWFRGHTNELRFMVEHVSQDLESLVITGRSYKAAGEVHGYWESDPVYVDVLRGKMTFTYSFDVISASSPLLGIHTSLLERRSSRHAPVGYSGFAHDLNDRVRIAVHSMKISSTLLPWSEALAHAQRTFKDV
jgi:hypothetical protein